MNIREGVEATQVPRSVRSKVAQENVLDRRGRRWQALHVRGYGLWKGLRPLGVQSGKQLRFSDDGFDPARSHRTPPGECTASVAQHFRQEVARACCASG